MTRGYYVQCLDGPAEGFAYLTFLPPDQVITVAPLPPRGRTVFAAAERDNRWFRVSEGSAPWLGEARYRRGDLPTWVNPLDDSMVDEDGDILVNYRVWDGT